MDSVCFAASLSVLFIKEEERLLMINRRNRPLGKIIAPENISVLCNDPVTRRRSLYWIFESLRDRINRRVKIECHSHSNLLDRLQKNCCSDIFLKCSQPHIPLVISFAEKHQIFDNISGLRVRYSLLTHTAFLISRILTANRYYCCKMYHTWLLCPKKHNHVPGTRRYLKPYYSK
jgi:hypothetical protein